MTELTKEQKAKVDALKNLPDEMIDTSDIPEGPLNAGKLIRGAFYQPVKRTVTVQLDEFVVEWFKEDGATDSDFADSINRALMEHIQRQRIQARRSGTKSTYKEKFNKPWT